MKARDQQFRCRCGRLTVTAPRAECEQRLGKHLQEEHRITDSIQMGLAVERVW